MPDSFLPAGFARSSDGGLRMKHYLFGEEGSFRKANLHTHTTYSDGSLTPEEAKKEYQARGYDIVAFSDHELLMPHPELTDEHFLALTSTEYEFVDFEDPSPFPLKKVYHMVLIASRPDETFYPWATRSAFWGNALNYIQDYCQGEHSRYPDQRNVNAAVAQAKERGYLVTFCHPGWSLNRYPDYCDLNGFDFVEVFNSDSGGAGRYSDTSENAFDDFLYLGKEVAPTASDDSHAVSHIGHGATYVKTKDLSYGSVYEALKAKNTFASTGPKFIDLTFDPETCVLTVDSDPVEVISVVTNKRYFRGSGRMNTGSVLTHGEYDLSNFVNAVREHGLLDRSYFRVDLRTADGKMAWSRGYFLKEFYPEEAKSEES